MGNHSETNYFDARFIPISFMSEECNISTFLPEYLEQVNILIYTRITALSLDSREVFILDIGQGKWFRKLM